MKFSLRKRKDVYRRKWGRNRAVDVWRGMREINGLQREKGGGAAEGNTKRQMS